MTMFPLRAFIVEGEGLWFSSRLSGSQQFHEEQRVYLGVVD